MKILKYLVIILLVLLGLWVVLAIVAPTKLVVERSTTVNAAMSTVFDQVNCFDNWPAWSPWDSMDTTNTNEYSDNPCGLDAWNSWKGEQTGEGTQTIVEVRPNEYIKTSLVFGGEPAAQVSEWFFNETESGVEVTWNYIGTEASFFSRPMNLVGKYFLTSAYETGLASLKEVAESAPESEQVSYDISEVDLPAGKFLLISGELDPEDIGDFYTESFGKIMAYLGAKGVEMAGYPTGLFYSWTDTLTKMAAAIPVAVNVAGTEEIEFREIEEGKALQIDYFGAYDQSGDAHYAMDDHIESNGLEVRGAVREVYITDPAEEPDTSKWQTRILYPIK